jgi:hypothetical protein
MRVVFVLFLIIYIASTGLAGLTLLFSDLSPQETFTSRTVATTIFYILASVVYGLIWPKYTKLAWLISWGALILASGAFIGSIGQGFREFLLSFVFVIPTVITVAGANFGKWLRFRDEKNISEKVVREEDGKKEN